MQSVQCKVLSEGSLEESGTEFPFSSILAFQMVTVVMRGNLFSALQSQLSCLNSL